MGKGKYHFTFAFSMAYFVVVPIVFNPSSYKLLVGLKIILK